MTTQIDYNNIQASTLAELTPVTVSQVQITDSSWTVLDDSAVSTSGGYILITGNNFQAGCNVIINSTNATSVSLVSSTTLRVQVPAMSVGTYVLYVTNTNGGTAIVVNGLTYSGTPTWVTSSPLAEQTVGVAVSIQFSATGDGSITYAVAAGSSLPSGLSLSSGGLLSGTVTGLTSSTTYNFTINAIDSQSQDSPKAFAVTLLAGDQYWSYVSTLLSASTPTTLPFNDDASTNNFAVTINGDTKPYNFNPYTPGYYSNYFDGSGDYISAPASSNFSFPGDFTIEGWMYFTNIAGGSPQALISIKSGTTEFDVRWYTTRWQVSLNSGGGTDIGSTPAPVNGVWTHVACVRSGTSIKLYVNGVATGTTLTNSSTLGQTAQPFCVGASATGGNIFTGNISNVRIVNGTALYTSNFTPPVSPLTAVANTVLLTCQSNRFIDNSTNNFTITRNGDTSIKSFNPFIPNSSYSTYGSTYFDGNGDYLNIASNSAFNLTGDFTIECWFYDDGSSALYPTLIGNVTGWSAGSFSFRYNNTGQANKVSIHWNGATPADPFISSSSTFPTKTWHHVAFTRSGSTCTLWVDGTSQGTGTYATALNLSYGGLNLGWSAWDTSNGYFKGYLSNVRINNGTALYTTTFTPPTTPLTAVSGTSLLTCQSDQPVANNTFLDNSTNNFAITRAGNTTQGTFSPYGASYSNIFDGSGDYLRLSSTAMALTSGDFTFETWVYLNALPASDNWPASYNSCMVLAECGSAGQGDGFSFILGSTQMFCQNSDAKYGTATHGMTVGQWYHVAYMRSGNTIYFFVNGVAKGSVSFSGNISTGAYTWVGCETGEGAYLNGYLSNLRIVKGSALYSTSGFTVPTSPLQAISGTTLLTCQSSSFRDASANNFAITVGGDTSVQRYSPFNGTTLSTVYYSGYFDGTGDYITAPNTGSVFTFGTGDFTIEAWINMTTLPSGSGYPASYWILGGGPTNADIGFDIAIGSANIQVGLTNFTSLNINYAHGMTSNIWYHVAVVRNGNTLSVYKNGTLLTSASVTGVTADPMLTGVAISAAEPSGATGGNFKGSISNLRVVKGTAVYTSAFTPSTSPLTAISGTSLLTCQSSTFIDNSSNALAITVAGNSIPVATSPFSITYSTKQQYSQSVIGGSMYFDGTGDYTTCNNSALAMGTGSFTWEAWIYWTTGSGYRQIFSTRTTNGSSTAQGSLALVASSNYLVWYTNTSIITTTVAVPAKTWAHVALVRNGTAMTLYLNGANVGTATNSDNLTASVFSVGANNDGTEPFAGYISDVRVIKGQALYTTPFAPSNTPLQSVQNTIYLANGTSGGIYDSAAVDALETVGDAKISTAVTKFSGGTSIYLDGTGDYLLAEPTPNLELGSGDFTIEFWLYRVGTGRMALYHGSFGADYSIGIDLSSVTANTIGIWASSNGSSWNLLNADTGGNGIGTIAVTQNTWTHIAFVRSGTTWMTFIDGVRDKNVTGVSGSIVNRATYPKAIAAWFSSGSMAQLNGYISDFRVTKGYARYTSTFTPPTTPFLTF